MSKLIDRFIGRNNNKSSSSTAKERLKLLLIHERINLSPAQMHEMKAEIIAVIARYVPDVDPDSVEVGLQQSDRYTNKLVAEIPFTTPSGEPAEDRDGNDDLDLDDVAEEDPRQNVPINHEDRNATDTFEFDDTPYDREQTAYQQTSEPENESDRFIAPQKTEQDD